MRPSLSSPINCVLCCYLCPAANLVVAGSLGSHWVTVINQEALFLFARLHFLEDVR